MHLAIVKLLREQIELFQIIIGLMKAETCIICVVHPKDAISNQDKEAKTDSGKNYNI